MSFKKLCIGRKSIRKFSRQEVSPDHVNKIIKIVLTAPSAGNIQAYEIVVVRNRPAREKLAKAALNQTFISEAPVVLAFVSIPHLSYQHYGARGAKLYSIQDATIACTYAMLAAEDTGLSSTWVGAFNEDEVKKTIDSEPDHIPVALLPIGFKVSEPYHTPRKSMEEMVREI